MNFQSQVMEHPWEQFAERYHIKHQGAISSTFHSGRGVLSQEGTLVREMNHSKNRSKWCEDAGGNKLKSSRKPNHPKKK